MSRIILNYALPLLTPLVLYLVWVYVLRHRSKARGDELPTVESGALFWSIVTGFALMIAGLVIVALTSGEAPGTGEYISPRLEGGKIIPPTFK